MVEQPVLFSSAFYTDPYPSYRALQETSPIHRDERMGWLVTRYSDIQTLEHDPRLSRAAFEAVRLHSVPNEVKAVAEPVLAGLALEMLRTDPPQHTRLRRLVAKAFTPRVVEGLRPRIQRIVDDLLESVVPNGGMEVIRDLAYPLPALVIMELLGIPEEDRDRLKAWTADRLTFLGGITVAPDPLAVAQRARESAYALGLCFSELIAARRVRPEEDLLSALVAVEAERDGRLSEAELVANAMALLTAGHETTANLIGNGLLALLRHPDEFRLLRDDLTRIPAAVEELLRFDSPVQLAPRAAVDDIVIGDAHICHGERVMLVLGAANRDPAQFVDPDRLDISRDPNAHLAFGFDRHFCLGAHLARLEGQVVFTSLAERYPGLKLTGQPVQWQANPAYRGLTGLAVTF